MKYGMWLDEWFRNYIQPSSKIKTCEKYSEIIEKHLKVKLGEYELDELTPLVLQRYVTELMHSGNIVTGKGLAANSVNGIITVIQNSLKLAYTLGELKEYTADKIKRPKRKEKDVSCFTLPEQKKATKLTAKAIGDYIKDDCQVVLSHSNGPQVGMIHTAMAEFARIYPEYTATPMSVCSAMSQGYIGYDLQNAIRTELLNRGIYKPVSTVLTQVTVDPYDEAFYHPTKIIGRVMTEEEAEAEEKKGNHTVKQGEGYRRIVAAPKPMDIVEIDAIRALSDADQVVIACGGGGIPVLEQDNNLKGASAVIEKDLAAGRLAELLDADQLIILTSVEHVCLNYGTANEQPLDEMTVEEAKQYMDEGQFEEGTMLPKIQAAIDYIGNSAVRSVLIANLEEALDGVSGLKGTLIHK